jgi:hypothetical protein
MLRFFIKYELKHRNDEGCGTGALQAEKVSEKVSGLLVEKASEKVSGRKGVRFICEIIG